MGQVWITDLLIPVIMLVVSSLMGYMVWLLQQQRKENQETRRVTSEELKAITRGVMLELRRDIIEEHNRYVSDKEPMMPLAYDNLCEVYDAYKSLGGNGMTDKLMEEISAVNVGKGGLR